MDVDPSTVSFIVDGFHYLISILTNLLSSGLYVSAWYAGVTDRISI